MQKSDQFNLNDGSDLKLNLLYSAKVLRSIYRRPFFLVRVCLIVCKIGRIGNGYSFVGVVIREGMM